ncbi:MAG: nitrous oxide-stimulated promoter family protein [Actinomycetota bacterium]|nr:nitrous oxide-stimulated promoter family protein [Actinomycetota bacterium]
MIRLYCSGRHGQKGALCKDCDELLSYAHARLKNCRHKESKPACAKCKTPCYEPKMRGRIREVMRFSGPRMLYRYPVLALSRLLDNFKKRTS